MASEGTNNILRYNGTSGAFMSEFVAASAGSEPFEDGLAAPKGVVFGPDGNLYVASNGAPKRALQIQRLNRRFYCRPG